MWEQAGEPIAHPEQNQRGAAAPTASPGKNFATLKKPEVSFRAKRRIPTISRPKLHSKVSPEKPRSPAQQRWTNTNPPIALGPPIRGATCFHLPQMEEKVWDQIGAKHATLKPPPKPHHNSQFTHPLHPAHKIIK
jgi:hypothetical protein